MSLAGSVGRSAGPAIVGSLAVALTPHAQLQHARKAGRQRKLQAIKASRWQRLYAAFRASWGPVSRSDTQ